MTQTFVAWVRSLASAEAQILLLSRSHPRNWQALVKDLSACWVRGDRCEPSFQFLPPPNLTRVRRELTQLAVTAKDRGPWGELFAQRALDLESEAALAEQIGRPGFRSLAQQRYASGGANFEQQADELATDWSRSAVETRNGPVVASDDPSNPTSLLNRLRAEMARCGVSVPIRIDTRIAAVAAVDRECIWVRGGEALAPNQARRIALHEIHGHVLRRIRARAPENALSSSGFRASDEDEEGRALWLEEKAELLDATRRRELGWRHLVARACQRGATFVEAVELMLGLGCAVKPAMKIGLRIFRGGGLARESIYLRAYLQVRRALNASPGMEQWMQRGRYSTNVAARLAAGELVVPRLELVRA